MFRDSGRAHDSRPVDTSHRRRWILVGRPGGPRPHAGDGVAASVASAPAR
jgi:hypothetical protein